MPDITFVTLTWNSERYVMRCLGSIADRCQAEGLAAEIFVVDNGSSDGSVASVEAFSHTHPGLVTIIRLEANRGTTSTRNLALRRARSPFVCVIDSDTEMISGAIRPILDRLSADRDLAIVAPRLVLADGTIQHSVKRFPTFIDKLRKVPRIVLGRSVPRTDFYGTFPFDRATPVETAISACWFFRSDLLDSVGLLDEGIFYAPEDLDYSARIREAGKYILYDPNLMLLHHTQQISHRHPLSRVSLSHLKGLVRYHRKHGGWMRQRAALAGRLPAAEPRQAHRPEGLSGEVVC